MRPLSESAKNILMTAVLLVVIGFVMYLAYGFFRVRSGVDQATVALVKSTQLPAVAPAAPKEGSALCDSVPLAISRDAKFDATVVSRGDTNDTVARFVLQNTTACPISIGKVAFLLESSELAMPLSSVSLSAGTTQFASPLVLSGPIKSFVFDGKTKTFTVPPYSTLYLAVTGGISKYAALGQSFDLALASLEGTNTGTGEPYAWSSAAFRMRVVSNMLDIQ